MIVRIGKILRLEVNGQVHYININSFSLKEVNNFVNFLQDDKLVVRVLLSDLSQSIEEIIQLTDETQEGERGESGEAGRNGENGDKGLDGKDGSSGVNGIDGRDGRNGQDGSDGKDGQDGKDGKDFEITPRLISEIRGKDGEDGGAGINGINGERGSDGTNGIDGINGLNGSNGIDGQSFVWSGEYDKSDTYEKNEIVEYQGASWIAITDVPENQPPLNPTQNKAFWDLAAARGIQGIQGISGATGLTGQGVPTGGTAGQHLAKIDATNYNTQWVNPEVDSNDKVGVSANDTTPSYLIDKVVAGTNVTVTELNDGGVETLQISASGGSSVFTPTINSTNMVEVSQESDFGTPDGSGNITLVTGTTYFIRGIVSCPNRLVIASEGISIVGWDRDKDGLDYTGSGGDFITVDNVNFEMLNLKLSSGNSVAGEVVLRALNFNYGTFNDGRLKVLTLINLQFRGCYDVHHIEGFDLVDIQNCLFWYIQATAMGCHFKNCSKLQITSCEYVRWFRESTIPTPGGYATTPLIELLANGLGNGFGAVNITGCIIHPQQTQDGLRLQPGSTTGFGTITGNTFINVGLTPNSHVATITLSGTSGTAEVLIGKFQPYLATFNTDLTTTASDFVTAFAQELFFRYGIALTSSGADIIFTSAVAGNVFYITSITNVTADLAGTLVHGTPIEGVVADLEPNSQNGYIIQANQGLENAASKAGLIIQGNANAFTAPTAYQTLNATNVGGSFTNSPYFPKARRVVTDRDDCSILYENKNSGSFFVAVNATVDGNNGFVTCQLTFTRGGVETPVPFATGTVEIKGAAETLAFTTLGQAQEGDVYKVQFIKDTGNLTVTEFTLNGYQF